MRVILVLLLLFFFLLTENWQLAHHLFYSTAMSYFLSYFSFCSKERGILDSVVKLLRAYEMKFCVANLIKKLSVGKELFTLNDCIVSSTYSESLMEKTWKQIKSNLIFFYPWKILLLFRHPSENTYPHPISALIYYLSLFFVFLFFFEWKRRETKMEWKLCCLKFLSSTLSELMKFYSWLRWKMI